MLFRGLVGAGGEVVPLSYSATAGSPAQAYGSSITVAYPSDVQEGDLLVVTGTESADRATPVISGWDNTYAVPYRIFSQKIATGSESGSVTVTGATNTTRVAVMIRFRNTKRLVFSAKPYTSPFSNSTNVTLLPNEPYTYFADFVGFAQTSRTASISSYPAFATPVASLTSSSSLFFAYIDTQTLEKEGESVYLSASGGNIVSWRSFFVYH